jgi:hypothetical protein
LYFSVKREETKKTIAKCSVKLYNITVKWFLSAPSDKL